MTDQQIEYNEIIDRFMDRHDEYPMKWNYHSSLDALKPVIQKFRRLEIVKEILNIRYKLWLDHIKAVCETLDVESLYHVIVNAIKWYNCYVKDTEVNAKFAELEEPIRKLIKEIVNEALSPAAIDAEDLHQLKKTLDRLRYTTILKPPLTFTAWIAKNGWDYIGDIRPTSGAVWKNSLGAIKCDSKEFRNLYAKYLEDEKTTYSHPS